MLPIKELAELERKQLFPIREEQKLFLLADRDILTSEAHRFTRLFAETWTTVPTADSLLHHWGQQGPIIELISENFNALGMASHRGVEIKFWAEYIPKMPDKIARTLIAHELAHVEQWSTGRMDWLDEQEAEYDAAATIRRWGYKQEALRRWKRENML